MQVLELPGGALQDEFLQGGHTQVHPSLEETCTRTHEGMHTSNWSKNTDKNLWTSPQACDRIRYLILTVPPNHVQRRFRDEGRFQYQLSEQSGGGRKEKLREGITNHALGHHKCSYWVWAKGLTF